MHRARFARIVSVVTSVILGLSSVSPSLLPGSALPAMAAGSLATDKVVSAHQTSGSTRVTSPAFTTSQAGEVLIAFVATDGPSQSASQAFSTVTGGGLSWRLRRRANTQFGASEIWQAVAPSVLTNASVTATYSGSYQAAITVATFTGADTTTDGATAAANGATGTPSATLATTRAGSWIWGVGNDWDNATARTVGPNQTKVDEYLA